MYLPALPKQHNNSALQQFVRPIGPTIEVLFRLQFIEW